MFEADIYIHEMNTYDKLLGIMSASELKLIRINLQ